MKYLIAAVASAALVSAALPASAATRTYNISMNGAQQVPPVVTAATGQASVVLDDVTGNVVVNGTFTNLSSNAFAAHIHNSSATVILPLGVPFATSGTISGTTQLSAANVAEMLAGKTYLNLHSLNFENGEIRAQIVAPAAVPALSPWGLPVTAVLLGAAAHFAIARRRAA